MSVKRYRVPEEFATVSTALTQFQIDHDAIVGWLLDGKECLALPYMPRVDARIVFPKGEYRMQGVTDEQ